MGFTEEMEKAMLMMFVMGMVLAVAFGSAGAVFSILFAVTLGVDMIGAIKLGVLAGALLGFTLGMLFVLIHAVKRSVKGE
mgnify:CR=1 FL=1